MTSLFIRNGTLVTMNADRQVLEANLLIENNRIKKIGKSLKSSSHKVIDAKNCWVLPGFIQTHVHLCQTLFRNQAENLELLDWLTKKIWPLEKKHTKESIFLSAKLGIAELLKGGTTTILDMGTLRHTEKIFEACQKMGIRAFCGKAMMDEGDTSLKESTKTSFEETEKLIEKWHGAAEGRLHYALAPRFVLSCSEKLLKKVKELSEKKNLLIHTHVSENKKECEEVLKQKGRSTIRYLNELGLCSQKSCFAHGVWLDDKELEILASTKTHILHCPSSNLKLGSGIANIPEMFKRGINVSLGADGAPCSNNLDMFQEMRLAGLIQKPFRGVNALSAQTLVEMATLNGAKALGIESEAGSLEIGKKADIIIISSYGTHQVPHGNIYDTLVYSCRADDVRTVIVNGKILVEDKVLKV